MRWRAARAVPGGETPALTGGRRDVVSRSATVPSRFEVLVAAG